MLSVGKFAKLGCVSEKTLHLYQRKGILTPAYVDEQTGYRYYEFEQLATLNAILQLQTAGFSLREIQGHIAADKPEQLQEAVARQRALLRERQLELAISQRVIAELLESCALISQKPESGIICEEELAPTAVLIFEKPGEAWTSDDEGGAESMQFVKEQLRQANLPVSLFRNVGGFATTESLLKEEGPLAFYRAFVNVEGLTNYLDCPWQVLDGGPHLIMYMEHHDSDAPTDIFAEEARLARELVREAKRRGLEIAGDYFNTTLAATPMFGFQNRDYFYRLCLPVRRP